MVSFPKREKLSLYKIILARYNNSPWLYKCDKIKEKLEAKLETKRIINEKE